MAIKNQWEKRVEVFHYIYQTLMTEETNSSKIISNAFEQNNFDAWQMQIIEYYANNQKTTSKLIADNLNKNWSYDRISDVVKSIIITAYCEAMSVKTDRKIIIDQAIITVKKYSEVQDAKFVNAILDKIIK